MEALRFENGKASLTQQILNMGLGVIVVGKNGQGYKKEEWCNSNTYYQASQENLLVADNRTRRYSECEDGEKTILARMVWADKAIDV